MNILREKKFFLHQSLATTLLFMNEVIPFVIPNYSSPISMSMQSLKKVGQKLLKLESGNEALTDGRMSVCSNISGLGLCHWEFYIGFKELIPIGLCAS